MIGEERPETQDVLLGIIGVSSHLPKYGDVRFVKEVTVKTERFDKGILDGPTYVGTYTIPVGWLIPLDGIERGEKRKPCRLNKFHALKCGSTVVQFLDVPEDSYELVRDEL